MVDRILYRRLLSRVKLSIQLAVDNDPTLKVHFSGALADMEQVGVKSCLDKKSEYDSWINGHDDDSIELLKKLLVKAKPELDEWVEMHFGKVRE